MKTELGGTAETKILKMSKSGQVRISRFLKNKDLNCLYYKKTGKRITFRIKERKGYEKRKIYKYKESSGFVAYSVSIPKGDLPVGMIKMSYYDDYFTIEPTKSQDETFVYTKRKTGHVNTELKVVVKADDQLYAGLDNTRLSMELHLLDGGYIKLCNSDGILGKAGSSTRSIESLDGSVLGTKISRCNTLHLPRAIINNYKIPAFIDLESKITEDAIYLKLPERCAVSGKEVKLGESAVRMVVSSTTEETLSVVTKLLEKETEDLESLLGIKSKLA